MLKLPLWEAEARRAPRAEKICVYVLTAMRVALIDVVKKLYYCIIP